MLEQLSQLTVGVAAVVALGLTVKLFVKYISARDIIFVEQLKARDDFNKLLIDNHFKHSQDRDEKIIDSIDRLADKVANKL